MDGNCVWLRCILLLWHLSIYYHNNYNSIPSLTLKVLLRKACRAVRYRLICPPPPTLPTSRKIQELETLQTMQQRVWTASGSPNTPTLAQTHNSNGSGQEAQGQRLFPSCILRRMKGNWKYFLGLYSGQGLGIISISGRSSSRPHFKFPRGNITSNYKNVSTIWHSYGQLCTSRSSFYCSKCKKTQLCFSPSWSNFHLRMVEHQCSLVF